MREERTWRGVRDTGGGTGPGVQSTERFSGPACKQEAPVCASGAGLKVTGSSMRDSRTERSWV